MLGRSGLAKNLKYAVTGYGAEKISIRLIGGAERATAARGTATPGDRPRQKAPYKMKMPSAVRARWTGMSPRAAKCWVGSGSEVYPPACSITSGFGSISG